MTARSILATGGVAFLLLALLTILLAGDRIEADLASRSAADLEAAGLGFATVELSGRDATVGGSAPDAASAARALEVVAGVWGVRDVADTIQRP
jgi:hypothetical protein